LANIEYFGLKCNECSLRQ